MASRRLDISSLLCDNTQPAFSPLEVLVQAATEERKRLGAPDDHHSPKNSPSDTRQSPVVDSHVAQSPRLSPHLSRYHVDDPQRIHLLQQPHYPQRTRVHHDNLAYPHYPLHSQSSRDFDFSLEADRRRRVQEAEHQQRLHEQQRIQELEHQRQQEHERVYRAQELERRRREEDQLCALEYQRELERREAERLQQLAEEKRREIERQRDLEERRQTERQFEHEQHRASTGTQHSQQFVNEQRQYDSERRSIFDMHPQQFPARQSPVVSPTSIEHLISAPDPPQTRPSTSSISPDSSANSIPPSQHDPRPIKKRRYSVSPTRHDDHERIARDRDRMVAGELGYARVESPVAGPSAPRRPGSHNQPRKAVAVADLLADKEQPPTSPLSQLAPSEPRDAYKTASPISRRSPPGSQIGRAKAARKSDEYIAALREHAHPPPTKDHVQSPILPESTEDPKIKQELKTNRLRISDQIRRTPTIDDSRQKKAIQPPSKIQSKSKQRDDPHEFFLHQYDQVPTPTKSAKSANIDSGGMPSPPINPVSPTPSPQNFSASAVVALDKELEDLVSSPTSSRVHSSSAPTVKVKKQEESDMDLALDLAVTELVENMENHDEKPAGMEVDDVEDELLSLLDDRLPPTSNSSRRSALSSIPGPNSHVYDLPSHLPSTSKQQQQQSMNQNACDSFHPTPLTISNVPASGAVVQASSIARPSSARAASDRDSMPPPASTTKGGTAKKAAERAGGTIPAELSSTTTAAGKKKKETTAKVSNAKSKNASGAANTKPKTKTSAKSKKSAAETNSTAATGRATPPSVPKATKGGKKAGGSASGSRSASIVPGGTPVAESEAANAAKEEEEADNEDDKLYCICKTKYDEGRFMIACDKCDEWYHTLCVNMPDLDVDLVDQFFCPSCIEKHPQSNLRTTYKQRCLWGLRHPNPDSPKACHKAARGAFSKYCSEECGINYMQTRVDNWAKKGGKTDKLWESVKNSERREGIVVCAVDSTKMDTEDADGYPVKPKIVRPSKTKIERETERLNNLLSSIVKTREDIQHGMEIVVCRERLLQLASERAEQVGLCGWDQRLCCDDEELADIGAGMLESYDDAKVDGGKEENGDTDMEVDGHEEQWWCPGKKVCDRHAGWQTIRYKDVCKEKEMKEEALAKLTLRERDLRKRIEDIHDPAANNTKKSKTNGSSAPLKSSTAKLVNGHPKSKVTEKKGKKRKAPSS